MIKVKKATFIEAMNYLKPALRELSRLAVPYEVKEKKGRIVIKVPKFIPV